MLMTRVRTVLGVCIAVALLVLGSVLGYRALAADKTATPKDRLADTLILLDKQWWEAASKYDVDTMGKILADDWVALGPDPAADWTRAISLDYYRRVRISEVKFLSQRRVNRVDEHTALMTYDVKWRSEDKGKGPREGWDHARILHCWVQRDGGWFIKYSQCVSLPVPREESVPLSPLNVPESGGKPEPAWRLGVRASGTWGTETPEKAFDGNRDTDWNAGDYAPAWIERDLGTCRPLAGVTLVPCQDIAGVTVHEVWVSDDPIGHNRSKARLVHTFKGETTNQQALKYDFPKDLSARYVQVRSTQSPTWIAWWEVEIRVRERGQVKVVPLEPEPKPTRDDKAALQGTWQVVSIESGGKDVTKPRQRKEEWVVKDGFIAVRSKDPDHVPINAVFAVHPDRRPKEIDINPYPIGAFMESDIVKGIYTLDGDVWKVCLRSILRDPPPKDWAERPKELATKEGSTAVLITLKRVGTGG
jgi:uncharacterized protein (TIGR03067 family)